MQEESMQYDKLIWSVVHKLLSKINDKYYYNGLEEDLFQEGYIGLLEAKLKYNPSSQSTDVKFTTFAYKYICGYCLNYLKKEFVSLRCEDIDSSPALSEESYDLDECFRINIIEELNDRLRITNKKVSQTEEKILNDRLCKEYSLQKCAELNNCSTKKVLNTINKYKDIMTDILKK
jgi:RNA polymerase sigma factor (sigma-70 family)